MMPTCHGVIQTRCAGPDHQNPKVQVELTIKLKNMTRLFIQIQVLGGQIFPLYKKFIRSFRHKELSLLAMLVLL